MAELFVKIDSDELVEEIQRLAAERGVTPQEEVRLILGQVLHRPLQQPAETEKEYTLRDHLFELGEIAPGIDFERVRTRSERPFEF